MGDHQRAVGGPTQDDAVEAPLIAERPGPAAHSAEGRGRRGRHRLIRGMLGDRGIVVSPGPSQSSRSLGKERVIATGIPGESDIYSESEYTAKLHQGGEG